LHYSPLACAPDCLMERNARVGHVKPSEVLRRHPRSRQLALVQHGASPEVVQVLHTARMPPVTRVPHAPPLLSGMGRRTVRAVHAPGGAGPICHAHAFLRPRVVRRLVLDLPRLWPPETQLTRPLHRSLNDVLVSRAISWNSEKAHRVRPRNVLGMRLARLPAHVDGPVRLRIVRARRKRRARHCFVMSVLYRQSCCSLNDTNSGYSPVKSLIY